MIRHLKNVRNLSLNWVLRSLTVLCYAFATSFLHYLCSKRRQEKITLRLWNVRSKRSQLDKNNFKDALHTDSVILTVDLRLDYNHCLEAIEDNFEPHTVKNRIFEVMFNFVIWRSWSSLDDLGDLVCFLSLFEGFETYIWMFLHHTVFTNIDSMFKTKLIRDSTFWTFAQSHFLCFLYFADFFFVCLLFHLCDVTQFWQFSAGKQSDFKTIQKLIVNSINFFPVQNSTFFLILINAKILISEINLILIINFIKLRF